MNKQDCISIIDNNKDFFHSLSDSIWDNPELGFNEYFAKDLICKALKDEGFILEENLASIPTAFSGTFGKGKPVIGFLGEFDALPNLSQKEDAFSKEEKANISCGHGCGHHNLGIGSLAAAFALKKYLKENNLSGTVIYFGCPAEENGSAKAFMARDNIFNDLDIALSWHPAAYNAVASGSTLANANILYKFHGISSHAAVAPHVGRSALDAVELMNVGANFLREHIISEARIHYAITNAGGNSPNVVHPYAEVSYLVRAPKVSQVNEIVERINNIAKGAALMTGTEVETEFLKACSNIVSNTTLGKVLYNNMTEVPIPTYSDKEYIYAKKMQETMANSNSPLDPIANIYGSEYADFFNSNSGKDINDFIIPFVPWDSAIMASSDVGDVSWICPTAQIVTSTWCANSFEHTWQVVAQGKSSIAHKGMLFAGKVLASTAIDLLHNPKIIEEAKKEFLNRTDGGNFTSPIPNEVKPIK